MAEAAVEAGEKDHITTRRFATGTWLSGSLIAFTARIMIVGTVANYAMTSALTWRSGSG